MARESDLGQGLGLGTSNGGVAQVVVECVRESARREGVGGWWCMAVLSWWSDLSG